jgi:UTP--glucose-1-phosphate uridylyltransferase
VRHEGLTGVQLRRAVGYTELPRSVAQLRFQKAVITAASPHQRNLPLQTLIDRDGQEKSVLGILIEQALSAGAGEICVVVWPGDQARYAQAAGGYSGAVRFVAQPRPLGYAHAVDCAREFVGADPFLHMVGDHLYVSRGRSAAQQVVEIAQSEGCSVSGVQATRESQLPYFGAVAGRRQPGHAGLYRVDTVIEKPTPSEAEQRLVVPGMRAGYYLCFFGVHAFTPTVMELLADAVAAAPDAPLTLSLVLAALARREQYLALEEEGRRYDLGARYGLLVSQVALALHGQERGAVLAHLAELLADSALHEGGRP